MKKWKKVEEVYIPSIGKSSHENKVIIRDYIPPMKQEDDYHTKLVLKDYFYLKRLKTGELIEILKDEFIIGVSLECDYIIDENDTISRKHAKIYKKDTSIYLEDLDSTNHTYVNNKKLDGSVKLENGNELRLSNEIFTFIIIEGHTL